MESENPGTGPFLSREEQDALVAANAKLVGLAIKPWVGILGPMHEEDLRSEGYLGLMYAATKFDPSRGVKFGTYAVWWIRAYVKEYLLRMKTIVRQPRSRGAARFGAKFKAVSHALPQLLGREPTAEDIAAYLDVEVESVRLARVARSSRDLMVSTTDHYLDEEASFTVVVEDGRAAPDEAMCRREVDRADEVRQALAVLDQREQRIIAARFLDVNPLSLSELGAELGISRERARQLESRALSKLRHALRGSKVAELIAP